MQSDFVSYFFQEFALLLSPASFERIKSRRKLCMTMRRSGPQRSIFLRIEFPQDRMTGSLLVGWSESHKEPEGSTYMRTLQALLAHRQGVNPSFAQFVRTLPHGWVPPGDLPIPGPNWIELTKSNLPKDVLEEALLAERGPQAREFFLKHNPGETDEEKLSSVDWADLEAWCGYKPQPSDFEWACRSACLTLSSFVSNAFAPIFEEI